jgi:tetratricopeptide (TPR) repeat protein
MKIPRTLLLAVASGLLLVGCSDPEQTKREHFDNANKFMAAEKYQEAIVEYRNALQADGRFGEARLKLSEAYQKVGNVNQAFREAVRAADLLPENDEAQIRAANFLVLSRRFEDAQTRIKSVIARNPRNVDAQIVLGMALVGLNDLDGALREMEEAIKLDPTRAESYSNVAAIQAQKGDRDAAKAAFEKAVEVDPKSIPARLSLAIFRWTTGDTVGAEDALKGAAAVDPKNERVNRLLSAFYTGTNRAAQAEPYLKTLAETGTVDSALRLADYYLATRRTADATALLQPLTKNPDAAGAAETRLAAIAYDSKDTVRAHAMLDAVIAREPNNIQALLAKAQWLMLEGKPKEALGPAQAAAKVDPRSVAAHFQIGVVHDTLQQPKEAMAAFNEVLRLNPRAVAAQVRLARLNLLAGAPDTAVSFAESALLTSPANPEARLGLVRALLARRDQTRAEQELAPLLKQYPEVSSVRAVNGQLKLRKKDAAGARAEYEKALELAPSSTEALAGLISVDLVQNRAPQARERIEARLAAEPNRVEYLILAAQVYGAQRDFTKAETTLRRVIQLDPASSRAYAMLANVLLSAGKLDAARVEFDQMAQRDPSNIGAQTMAAMIVHSQNQNAADVTRRNAEAKKRYEAIVNAEPTAAVAANNLAWIYQEENIRLDDALRLAQGAAARLPNSGEVPDTICMIYIRKAQPALAVAPCEQAIEKQPDNPSYHYHLALALRDSGDARRAREAAEQALKLRPGYAEAQKLLAEIKS